MARGINEPIIGIDEVGRGCWAGPLLVVAAQAVKKLPKGLKDSKLLSKKQREALFEKIVNSCDLGEGWVEPTEIDSLGLTQATKLGVERALLSINASVDQPIIIDGNYNFCSAQYTDVSCVIDGDAKIGIISAASIYAKVKRDQYMSEQAKVHPIYGFENHVGYGTAEHKSKLREHGICPLHRLSFKPVQEMI